MKVFLDTLRICMKKAESSSEQCNLISRLSAALQENLQGKLPAAKITPDYSKQSTQQQVKGWIMARQGIVSKPSR